MKLMLQTYLNKTAELLTSENVIENSLIEHHLHMITFFSHERFIHLLITMFVAFLCLFFLCLGFCFHIFLFHLIFIILLVLLLPYLLHYYFLENGVQSLYKQYLAMMQKKKR